MAAPLIATGKLIRVYNGQFARPITLPARWSTLRIGIGTGGYNNTADVTGAKWALGLCEGTTNLVGDVTTDKFVGYVSTPGGLFDYAGNGYGIPLQTGVKVGTTWTYSDAFATSLNHAYGGLYGYNFFDITRVSSTEYSFTFWNMANGVSYTDSAFRSYMEFAVPSAGHTQVGPVTLSYPAGLDLTAPAVAYWYTHPTVYLDVYAISVGLLR